MDAPLFPALFALNILLAIEGEQTYSQARVEEMLAEAGLVAVDGCPWGRPVPPASWSAPDTALRERLKKR